MQIIYEGWFYHDEKRFCHVWIWKEDRCPICGGKGEKHEPPDKGVETMHRLTDKQILQRRLQILRSHRPMDVNDRSEARMVTHLLETIERTEALDRNDIRHYCELCHQVKA